MKKKFIATTLALSLGLTLPLSASAMDFSNVGKVRTNLSKVNDTVSCVNDSGKHLEEVQKFVEKYFDGKISELSTSNSGFLDNRGLENYVECDVINYSIGIYPLFFGVADRAQKIKDFKEEEYNNLNSFLKQYDGIIVNSAGNEAGDSTQSSPLARYKEMSILKGETKDNYRLFVVGQIEIDKDGNYIHHFSGGDYVDFVVPNYNEGILHYQKDFQGTSYSAPVASALISQLLQSGIPKEDIRNVLGFEDKNHYYNGKEYKVLSVFKTIRNAYDYHKIK